MASKVIGLLAVLISIQGGYGQLPGGWNNANVTSKDVIDAAKNALNLYRGQDANKLSLLEILNASQQVVAGMNYKLTLSIGLSNCPTKETFHRACFLEWTMTCDFRIFKSLEGTYNLTSSSCGNKTTAWSQVQTDTRIVVDSVSSAVRQLSKSGLLKRSLELNRIEAAYVNIKIPDIYKVSVFLRSKCPPCVSADQQFVISKALLFLNANTTSSRLLDCKTDSPILKSLTRCGISVHRL